MGIYDIIYGFYDGIFGGLLHVGGLTNGALLTILLISTVISILITFSYKLFTKGDERQQLKKKMKEYRKKMEAAKEKGNMDLAQKYMKQSLDLNKQMFRMNMKPMILSFALVLIIFPWMSHTFAETVTLEHIGNESFEGSFGYFEHTVPITAQEIYSDEFDETRLVIESSEQKLKRGDLLRVGESRWEVKRIDRVENSEPAIQLQLSFVTFAGPFPLIGRLEWLGFYILVSLPITIGLRKLLKVD